MLVMLGRGGPGIEFFSTKMDHVPEAFSDAVHACYTSVCGVDFANEGDFEGEFVVGDGLEEGMDEGGHALLGVGAFGHDVDFEGDRWLVVVCGRGGGERELAMVW